MFIVAFALLVVLSPAAGTPSRASDHKPAREAERGVISGMHPGDLYSARAKRRIASYLRMRLLELRLHSLDRAAAVVQHRLTLEELLRTP